MERIRIIEAKVVSRNAKVMVPVRKTVIKWGETCDGKINYRKNVTDYYNQPVFAFLW